MTSDQPDQSFRIDFTGNSNSPTVERINETPPSTNKTEQPAEGSTVEANEHNGDQDVTDASPAAAAEREIPVDPLVVPVSVETRDSLVDQLGVAVNISSAELGARLAAHLEKELNTEGE